MNALSIDTAARKAWMGLLARTQPAHLAAFMPDLPDHAVLRGPEVGAVMVRGRVGGTGQPFNLGEMTVTRCSVRLADGAVGHAHVQGRDKAHALRAAVVDALMQTTEAEAVENRILAPLRTTETQARSLRATKAAATKVEFFTRVRGEDK